MSHKILIADDEPNILISLEYLMKREGFEVRLARDGQEVLDAVAADCPDLLLLDIMMPGKSGFEVCQALRGDAAAEDGPPRKPRILMLSAKGRDTDVAKGLALGADGYMTKPFSTRELLDRVKALLAEER